jgi:hypothetical protein
LIQDTFAPIDNNFDDIRDVPLIEKSQKTPLRRLEEKSSLCYIVGGEIEGI